MFSKRISKLTPYLPGEQPKDRVYIKLNANENPYPPPKEVCNKVIELLEQKPQVMSLYPDPESLLLKQAISEHLNITGGCMNKPVALNHKITPEMIFCGNGSDEVLSFIFYTFFDSENQLVAPLHTYSFYPVYCGFYGIPLEKVPLNQDFSLDSQTMLNKAITNRNGIIFANPNAPTAISMSLNEIRQMLLKYPKELPFIVDEAYVDFADESILSLLPEFENLIVIRTFSKSMSFAGMRLGYAVANEKMIKVLSTTKNSFNHFPIDGITQCAGIAACKKTDYYIEITKKIVNTRTNFCKFLTENNWIFIPSTTNFVLVKKQKYTGKEVYEFIRENGILVRYFDIPDICDYVRITIGTDEQMLQLQKVMMELK